MTDPQKLLVIPRSGSIDPVSENCWEFSVKSHLWTREGGGINGYGVKGGYREPQYDTAF